MTYSLMRSVISCDEWAVEVRGISLVSRLLLTASVCLMSVLSAYVCVPVYPLEDIFLHRASTNGIESQTPAEQGMRLNDRLYF